MDKQSSSDEDRSGTPVPPSPDAPILRKRGNDQEGFSPHETSSGYTSRGYVEHFLPDREVNLNVLNKALADVFGEPALRGKRLELEIDEEYWNQISQDPWSGNIYKYNF